MSEPSFVSFVTVIEVTEPYTQHFFFLTIC